MCGGQNELVAIILRVIWEGGYLVGKEVLKNKKYDLVDHGGRKMEGI